MVEHHEQWTYGVAFLLVRVRRLSVLDLPLLPDAKWRGRRLCGYPH